MQGVGPVPFFEHIRQFLISVAKIAPLRRMRNKNWLSAITRGYAGPDRKETENGERGKGSDAPPGRRQKSERAKSTNCRASESGSAAAWTNEKSRVRVRLSISTIRNAPLRSSSTTEMTETIAIASLWRT